MKRLVSGIVVAGVIAAAGAGWAVARDSGPEPTSVAARAIDWAVETGEPVESHPEIVPLLRDAGDDVPEGAVDGLSIAELQDLTTVAEQLDQSGAEVIAGATREREYIAVYTEASRSDSFAGGVLGHGGDETWVGFTGDAPSGIKARADKAGVTVKEDLPRSRSDLEALQRRVHRAASAKGDAVTTIDESTSRITVLTNASADQVEGEIARELSTSVDRLGTDFPIDVVHRDGSLGGNE